MSRHLLILGGGERLWRLAGHLRDAGVPLTFVSKEGAEAARGAKQTAPALVLLEASRPRELEALTPWAWKAPWLLLGSGSADGAPAPTEVLVHAYRTGALAALPADTPDALVVETVRQRLLAAEQSVPEPEPAPQPRRWYHPAGAGIPLHAGEALRVISGVVAQVAWHRDGTEGLVGLWGRGHVLPGHPEDSCCLALRAHTDVTLETSPMAGDGGVTSSLLERIRLLEAWSAMQSRPSMEQRLLGVLDLLAEQFGRPEGDGTVVDLRVTHAQLAAAIGANRATVTRLFGPLRRRGLVTKISGEKGERLFLPGWQRGVGHEAGRILGPRPPHEEPGGRQPPREGGTGQTLRDR